MKNTLRFFKKITPMLVLAAIMMAPIWGWGQTTIAAWTYPTSSGDAPNTLAAECGALQASSNFYADGTNGSDNWTDVSSRQYYVGRVPTPALCAVTTATGAYSLVNSPDTYNGKSVVFKISTTGYQGLALSYDTRGTSTGFTTHVWSYSTDGTNFTTQSTINGRNATSFSTQTVDFSSKLALNNQSNVYIKLTVSGATGAGNNRLDNINFTASVSAGTPNITVGTITDFGNQQINTTSPEQTYNVSGSNLTANITITPPTGFLISTSSGSGYTSTPIILTQSEGTVTSTPIYVVFSPSLAQAYSGNITHESSGATTMNVAVSGIGTAPPDAEPTNHATNFAVATGSPTYSTIDVVWDDATGGVVPTAYLIKGSSVSYAAIVAPSDGTPEADAALVKNIAAGIQTASFTGLTENTTYYFKIFPYTNSGATIDYKTDGTVPQDEATTAVAPPVPAIYFTEYIEGSSSNKALEIYNGTGSSIDLSLLTVNNYANGNATASNTYTGEGTLNQGATFVIGNKDAAAGIASKADVTSTVTYFNGDDAVELVYDGQTIDIIGIIGEKPTTGWNVAGVSTATVNHTLIRKLNVTTGNTNWAISAGTDVNDSEWVVKDNDYFENLSFVGTVWQGVSTDWTAEANWDMGVPSIYQAWVVPATEAPVVSTTETVSDVIVLGNDLHISPTGFLTVNNLLGIVEPGMVTVEPLGKLSGEVINFGTADLMVIQSDATGTGSVITDWNSQATIQRYLTGGWDGWDAGWHQLSSPVAAQPIADFATTGVGNDYDFYGWDEPSNMWMNYKEAGFSTWNGGTNFNVGQGYLVSYEAANTTQTFSGVLNTADVIFTDLSNGGASYNGWHLLGNPFASALVWNDGNWILDNTAGNAKIWHEVNKSYSDIASYGIIPSAQGFMVQVSSASNMIGIPGDSRVHDAQPFYKSGNAQLLLVVAETEGGSAQESKIMVNPMATEGFDFDYDSRFLAGYAPQLYSVVGDEMLSTNSLPDLGSGKVIPLGFVKNAATTFTIQLKESIPGTVVYLTDIQTGTLTNLTETPVYSFTSDEGDDANRFSLAFGTVGISHPEATAGVQVFAHDGVLYVETPSKEVAQFSVYNLTGQLVLQGRTRGNALSTFNASALNTGVYVVNILLTDGVVSRKVVINK